MRDGIIARITAETPWSGPIERTDGSMLQVATVPLPDGNVLLTCLDVTDTARVERALRERNEALETAARLKSEFIANVSLRAAHAAQCDHRLRRDPEQPVFRRP